MIKIKKIRRILATGMLAAMTCFKLYAAPEIENQNRAYDVKHIVLNLKFDWEQKTAIGTCNLTLTPSSNLGSIVLDAVNLFIQKIQVGNEDLTFDNQSPLLIIKSNKYFQKNKPVTVTIYYQTKHVNEINPAVLSGSNGSGLRFSQPTSNDPLKPKEVYSSGEYRGNRYWYPCNENPSDLITTEHILTVDSQLTAIANGQLYSKKNNGDGTSTIHFKDEKPHANYLTAFIASTYSAVTHPAKNIDVKTFCYKGEEEFGRASATRLTDMIQFFETYTGIVYPHKSYAQCSAQDLPSWASANSFSIITENMLDDSTTHADFYYLWDLTEAEALANQWTASLTPCSEWKHIWLNRGLGHYLNLLYDEYKNGKVEHLSYVLPYDQSIYFNDWNSGIKHPIAMDFPPNQLDSLLTDNYSYFHASNILHMLRKEIGDENFKTAIRAFLKNNAGKPSTTKQFMQAVSTACKRDMEWFFKQWFYGMGHPAFTVTKKYSASKKQIELMVHQNQLVDTNINKDQEQYFRGKVFIEVENRIHEVEILPQATNTYYLPSDQPPAFVNFDFESTWIKEISFEKSAQEYLAILTKSKDIVARNDAAIMLGSIAITDTCSPQLKNEIKNTFIQQLNSSAYFRYKQTVLFQLQQLCPRNASKQLTPDEEIKKIVLSLIEKEKSWLKASAIAFLGNTYDSAYKNIYCAELNNPSERVASAAATALAKTKCSEAYQAIYQFSKRPSMKSQNLLSALSAFQLLENAAACQLAMDVLADANLPRWRLPDFSVWDYRVNAVQLIAKLGNKQTVTELLRKRFEMAMAENDLAGEFNNALLISLLAPADASDIFVQLKSKYLQKEKYVEAAKALENQYFENLKN